MMGITAKPMARPRRSSRNQRPMFLVTATVTTSRTAPLINTVTISIPNESDRPLKAPVTAVRKQNTMRVRRVPKRSTMTPASRLIKMPAKFTTPQTEAICTRLRPRSSEISLKRTGNAEMGIVLTKALVATIRASINHLV